MPPGWKKSTDRGVRDVGGTGVHRPSTMTASTLSPLVRWLVSSAENGR